MVIIDLYSTCRRKPVQVFGDTEKMCRSKIQYVNTLQAQIAAGYFEEAYNRPYRVYNCPNCKLYHLTTKM